MRKRPNLFSCDRCAKKLAGVSMLDDSENWWVPQEGMLLLSTLLDPRQGDPELGIEDWERVLCYECADRPDSWPWWEDLANCPDGDISLVVHYDEDFPLCQRTYNVHGLPYEWRQKAKDCDRPDCDCKIPNRKRLWS